VPRPLGVDDHGRKVASYIDHEGIEESIAYVEAQANELERALAF
jgi:hypothetical protein